MKPYYADEQVTLYCGDFRELMPGVLAIHGEPDLVLTDPPYGETSLAWDRWPDGWPQLIPGRIDRARGVEDLAQPAHDIAAQAERLHRQGIRVEAIAEITSDLNRRLFAHLYALLAPPSVRQAGCLLLMGSEGRGEQTVRTDQDNGLLLAEPAPAAELDRFREAFSGAWFQV